MLRDLNGNRLFRKVEITIFFPDNIFPLKKMTQRAGPHQGFGPNGVDDLLMQVADDLEVKFPWWEFKFIELAPVGRTARFVFTFAGYRASTPNTKTTESSTPAPEVTEGNTPAEAGNTPNDPSLLEQVQGGFNGA